LNNFDSCEPNAIVKRTPSLNNIGAREARPSRIYVVAMKDIPEGEEISASAWVNKQKLELKS
jgi:SET domain-containing protein